MWLLKRSYGEPPESALSFETFFGRGGKNSRCLRVQASREVYGPQQAVNLKAAAGLPQSKVLRTIRGNVALPALDCGSLLPLSARKPCCLALQDGLEQSSPSQRRGNQTYCSETSCCLCFLIKKSHKKRQILLFSIIKNTHVETNPEATAKNFSLFWKQLPVSFHH